MLNLKEYRDKAKGLSDLLKYGRLVNDRVIMNKDGSMTAMYHFRGTDSDSSTHAELNFIADQVNRALRTLGDGWAMHVDAIRTAENFYPPTCKDADPFSRLLDEERRRFFQNSVCYTTEQYMTLTYLPPYRADTLIAAASGQKIEQNIETLLVTFERQLQTLEDTLGSVLVMERLGSYEAEEADFHGKPHQVRYSELLSILHYIVTGILQPMREPCIAMYLDAVIATQDLLGGVTPKIGDNYIAAISIDDFPAASYPAMLSTLDALPFEFRFNTRFLFMDKASAKKELNTYYKEWNQKVFKFLQHLFPSPNPRVNKDARNMADDAQEAMNELEADEAGYGYLSTTIILTNEDPQALEESARAVRKVMQGLSFGCRIETINTLDAWLGTHPGNTYANVRRPLISTMNLSHLLPLATIWNGDTACQNPLYPVNSPCLAVLTTDGSTPFYYDPHVGDVGHAFIVGTTGTGKSTLLGLHAFSFMARYNNAQLFCFDKSRSMEILCHGLNGQHFDIGKSNSRLSFAPLSLVGDDPAELRWAQDWIETLITLQVPGGLTPKQRITVTEALKELALQPKHLRRLSHFYNIVHAKEQRLAEALNPYTEDGALGMMLDAAEDNLSLSRFNVFEIEELMEMGDKNLIPVLLYLFHRIEKSLTGQPSMIILDEAWIMLGHPVFKEKIREWLKMLRKACCAVILATQQLTDAINSGIMPVLIDSCLTKIYLPNIEAKGNAALTRIYEDQGLNEIEIETIFSATPKKDYFIKSSNGRRMVNLALGPKTLAFIGKSGKEDIAKVRELMKKHPDTWTDEWLKLNRTA